MLVIGQRDVQKPETEPKPEPKLICSSHWTGFIIALGHNDAFAAKLIENFSISSNLALLTETDSLRNVE